MVPLKAGRLGFIGAPTRKSLVAVGDLVPGASIGPDCEWRFARAEKLGDVNDSKELPPRHSPQYS
jgi:hypothetical protein